MLEIVLYCGKKDDIIRRNRHGSTKPTESIKTVKRIEFDGSVSGGLVPARDEQRKFPRHMSQGFSPW